MIRQELMDNIQEIKNKLEVVIDIKDRGIDRLEMVKEAYLSATKLETMVAGELEAQRQEQSEYIIGIEFGTEDVKDMDRMLKEVDDELKMGIGIYDTEETKAFKRWCYYNNRSFNNGQVLNEYMKERGV